MEARRDNIGTLPSFVFSEICMGLNIPHEVMQHPAIASLERDATDMIIIGNVSTVLRIDVRQLIFLQDVCSYKKEVLSDDAAYNLVTVAIANTGMDLDGAMQWISDRHDQLAYNFLKTMDDVIHHKNGVPTWGESIDKQVATYIDCLGE